MARVKVNCYEIPIELGDHVLFLISTKSEKAADNYIKRNFKVKLTHQPEEGSTAYFAGHLNYLFLFFPPETPLEYLVHEIVHTYKYMINRMGTSPDEEGEAYITQMLFKKIVEKLIEVNLLKIEYVK